MIKLPHPIPYQGSKRLLAPLIGRYIPDRIDTWYEPFAGSAAMSLWAAAKRNPRRIVLGDSLAPMMHLWQAILAHPGQTASRYTEIWMGQTAGDPDYFNRVRERFNENSDPVDLLYLLCRCVKNAVRFNAKGAFTQSVDKRRLGMRPDKMRAAIEGASRLLSGKTEIRASDWVDTLVDAKPGDFIYMDPPYLGTSIGRDRRYAEWMTQERLVAGLRPLIARRIEFALSYDGMCGEKVYAPPLPDDLRLVRLSLHAGRSSQATLNGGTDETVESLYLSEGLAEPVMEVLRLDRSLARQAVLAY
ncbi:DNA adenine methylase [Asaia bogorensis]|uniref:DNA adenine methylase n=1 Tax=Asaia bogorensis TaxID=91915 RepID=UPI000EFCBA52|nr:DNA adenine methylase [Asaia bogorensis]